MRFHHHPDGIIILRGEDGAVLYAEPLAQFQADLREIGARPYEGLPAGARERRWEPRRHLIVAEGGLPEDGPADWPGGVYLAAAEALAARSRFREEAEARRQEQEHAQREAAHIAFVREAEDALDALAQTEAAEDQAPAEAEDASGALDPT